MTQCNNLNVKLFNWQLNKLNLGIKTSTEVFLNLSSNVVGNSYDDNKFPHKLLLTNTQLLRLHKPFANGSLANTKFSETLLSKVIQSEGFIELVDKIFGPTMRVALEVPGMILLDARYNLVNN